MRRYVPRRMFVVSFPSLSVVLVFMRWLDIVPKVFHMTYANNADDGAPRGERADMARVLLESYRACTASSACSFILFLCLLLFLTNKNKTKKDLSQGAIVKYVLPGLQTLGRDAQRLLDSTYSALVQSMVVRVPETSRVLGVCSCDGW
jgi:hypothetical protein